MVVLPEELDLPGEIAERLKPAIEEAVRTMPPVETPLLEEFITPEVFAEEIGHRLKVRTIREYVRQGKIPGVCEHGFIMVNRKKVLEKWRAANHENDKP